MTEGEWTLEVLATEPLSSAARPAPAGGLT